jgi:hypothetical protein
MLDNGLDGSLLLQFLTAMFKVRADQVGWVYFKIWTLLQVKPVTLFGWRSGQAPSTQRSLHCNSEVSEARNAETEAKTSHRRFIAV